MKCIDSVGDVVAESSKQSESGGVWGTVALVQNSTETKR